MIEPLRIVATEPQQVAMVRLCVPWTEMRHVIGPGLTEVRDAVAAQGIATAGPWLTHHFRMPTDTLDFAICVPVAAAVAAMGRVEPGQLPAANVVRTVMHGDYAGLAAAWGELRDWIAATGHTTRAGFWECYTIGPESSTDPADWRTELTWPLAEETPITTR